MQPARVVGTATSTVKHRSLERAKLLIVQPLLADGRSPDGEPVLSVDAWGAGWGDLVLLNSDGEAAQEQLGDPRTPARYSVLGLYDCPVLADSDAPRHGRD